MLAEDASIVGADDGAGGVGHVGAEEVGHLDLADEADALAVFFLGGGEAGAAGEGAKIGFEQIADGETGVAELGLGKKGEEVGLVFVGVGAFEQGAPGDAEREVADGEDGHGGAFLTPGRGRRHRRGAPHGVGLASRPHPAYPARDCSQRQRNAPMAVERTLSILKPDATRRNLTGRINAKFEAAGLRIVAQKRLQLSEAQAGAFYAVHAARPFYKDLVGFMISGPVVVQVLEGENAVQANRDIMGATNPANAAEGTIRKEFAESIEANSVHGSDSAENAATEIAFFFAGTEIVG